MPGRKPAIGRDATNGAGSGATREPRPAPGASPPGLLLSKLRPPRPRVPLVERRALVELLGSRDEPLVVVSAPAGSGKSLLLAQWARAVARPVSWLHIDEADNDRVVFLTYLAAALGLVAPVDAGVFVALRLRVPPVRERVLPLLAEALGAAPPFLLVLDDAHLLANAGCWDVVSFLLSELPEGAQLALATRRDPPLPLPRLRAEGRLFELRGEALELGRDEASEMLRLHAGDAGDDVVDAVLEATEGWATGVYLAALAMRGRPAEDWTARVRGDRREIADYLASEVLRRAPEAQDFLLETAVVERLSPSLCRAITGRDDAGRLLPWLARNNLFVLPLDDRDEWFRYHHLLAELLRAELERQRPDDVPRLHRNAAGWFLARGDVDGGVRHLLAARDVADAAGLVASAWVRYWDRGQIETVRRWLEAFTEEEILEHPALTLTAGWVLSAVGDARQAKRWARAACSAQVDDAPSPDGAVSLRSSQAILRATIGPDGVTGMREAAALAARLEARGGTSWHVDACQALGATLWLSGSPRKAVAPLERAMRDGVELNPPAELAALGFLALIAADGGEWEAAREYERRATERLAELGFGSLRRSLPMLLARARVQAHDRARVVEGLCEEIDDILSRLEPHVWLRLLGEITLGEVALTCADLAEADRRCAQARRLLNEYPDAGVLRARAERLRDAVAQRRMTEPLTAAEARVLELLPTHFTEEQIARELFVSRNTVKSHLRALYRKLEASSRAQAVERARELGLLRAP